MTTLSPIASRITGTGSAFPSKVLTNQDLTLRLDTSDEWIRERTGISQRRISEPGNPNDLNSSITFEAAKRALEMAGKAPMDIDAIFYGTFTPDTLVPSASCWLQQKLGAKRAFGVDLNAACSGFVFALATADQFIRTGTIKTALAIGTDITSAFTNWNDRSSCILFGDGAGVAVVEATQADSPHRILSTHLGINGEHWETLYIPAGGSAQEVTPERHAQGMDKMNMKGREIFKVAVKSLADYAVLALESNGYKLADVDWVIPHQANLRIIEAVAKRLDLPMEKMLVNIDRYGNTSAATVPTMLDEAVRDGRIKPGQLVLMDVFGAGLTYGSILVRWG